MLLSQKPSNISRCVKGLEGNQGQICEIKYSDITLYMLTGISCTCSCKCSFFPPISPFTLALFTLFAMLPCAGAGSILDFTQQLGFHSAQFSLVAIMAMLHLIWSHQNVFSSTTSRFWALIQMCMHQLGYKGSLHGYFASQCLLIWKFLPRNKLDWLCRLLMV